MSFLEGDEKEGPRPSQVFGLIQKVPQDSYRTQGPVFFELSIYTGSQSRNSHFENLLLLVRFLAMKSEEGNKATFSHWSRLDTLFATQAWISLWRMPEAKASKKAVLRVRCLRSVSFIDSKDAFVSSLRTTERFHLGRFLELLGQSLWKLESNP